MGDRHNIGLVQEGRQILWLYSHWGFYTNNTEKFSGVVAEALNEARDRWDDESYFNRIFIHALGDSLSGVNLDKAFMDEHKRFVVDITEGTVSLYSNYDWDGLYENMPEPIFSLSLGDFVEKYLA